MRNHDDSIIVVNDSNKRISISRKTFREDETDDKGGVESASELLELDANGDAYYLVEPMENKTNFKLKVKYLDQVQEFGSFYVYERADSVGYEPEVTELDVKLLTDKYFMAIQRLSWQFEELRLILI